jgi:hypothetical protein
MPIIRERDPDLVYTRAERENGWVAFLLVFLLLLAVGVFAFLALSKDNDRRALMDQLDILRLQQSSTPPPMTQTVPVPVTVPQPIAVPVPQPVATPAPTTIIQTPAPSSPSPAPSRSSSPAPSSSSSDSSSGSSSTTDTNTDTTGTGTTP